MQAFALQATLSKMDLIPETTYCPRKNARSKVRANIGYLGRKLLSFVGMKVQDLPPNFSLCTTKNTQDFVEKNINLRDFRELNLNILEDSYHALVVGSDQVWRERYVPVKRYLFDFVSPSSSIIRMSYAASFGRDDLTEYDPRLVKESSELAKRFDAISVREDTGVELVERFWSRRAQQHVDPTLLLESADYSKMVEADLENLEETPGQLFLYLLDKEPHKRSIASIVCNTLNLEPFELIPPLPTSQREFKKNPEKFQLPPVTQWLKSFIDSEFVVTDSFHGTVFSIIFKKPFIAIGNPERGLTRFTSLLSLFGLESRLVSRTEDVTEQLVQEKINWEEVSVAIERERRRSFSFLSQHLKIEEE